MEIQIEQAKDLAIKVLKKYGFSKEEALYCTENFLDGELTGKKSHGFVRIPLMIKGVKNGKIKVQGEEISIIRETPVSLLIDGKQKTGLYVINKALEIAIKKVNKTGMLITGVTNTSLISGLIGQYARKASEKDLIYIAFNNCPGGLVPYGSIKAILGTNPITVGIPTFDFPIILDMASSKITWGHLLMAISEGKCIPENTAIDEQGNKTIDPLKAIKGGVLPISGHKGSGLAFVIEILAGALTGSRCGYQIKGGWGSLFILIDPNIFRPIEDFKNDIKSLIQEIKGSKKAAHLDAIYYPGEKSQLERKKNYQRGTFNINYNLYKNIYNLLNE